MGAAKKVSIGFSELLALEAETGEKYEYHDGYPISMAGGTPNHGLISNNIGGVFFIAFTGKDCAAYSSDVRVAIEAEGSYVYPDASVVCGPPETAAGNSITNPVLLVEVMSDSTEVYDRGEKFAMYRCIPSLRYYVLVSQKKAHVESYRKTPEGFWVLSEAKGLAASVPLPSLDVDLKLSDIYRNVLFPPSVHGSVSTAG